MGKLSWFPKYVLGPALAAALGFWVIGPRLAGNKKLESLVKEKTAQMAAGVADEPEKPTESEPQVTVGVKPVEEAPRRRRRD